MDMTFDVATQQLTIDTADIHPWGTDLRAVLNRYGHTVNLRGVTMRLTITADRAQVFDMQLPPPGVRYRKTDQDVLATGRAHWRPDQQITVNASCKTSTGLDLAAEATFVAPRPTQPYASWTWVEGQWHAPEPYPDDGGEYQWNESSETWIESEEAV